MFKVIRRLVLLPVLVVVPVWLAFDQGVPGLLFGWLLLGYLLVRAFPAVRSDFRRLRRFLPAKMAFVSPVGKHSRSTRSGDL